MADQGWILLDEEADGTAKSKTQQHQQDVELARVWPDPPVESVGATAGTIPGKVYRQELAKLQVEPVKCQEWIRARGLKVVILFDRSWYNRAGVERVMDFCTEEEYQEFMRSCPEFERMFVRSGLTIIKYWFSVSDDEQERRFQARIDDPTKGWKLSPMDLQSRARLNVIHHLLSLIPYEDLTPEPIVLPPRQPDSGYVRPPITDQTFVPEVY